MNHTVISKETYIYIYIYTQYLLLITNTAIMYNECTLNCGLNICGSRRNFFTKRNLCKYGLKVFVVAIIFCCHSVNFLAFALQFSHITFATSTVGTVAAAVVVVVSAIIIDVAASAAVVNLVLLLLLLLIQISSSFCCWSCFCYILDPVLVMFFVLISVAIVFVIIITTFSCSYF